VHGGGSNDDRARGVETHAILALTTMYVDAGAAPLLMVFKPFSDGALIFKSVYLNVFTSDKHYSMNFRYYVLLDFLGVLIRRTG
jgi:hypothetical protein